MHVQVCFSDQGLHFELPVGFRDLGLDSSARNWGLGSRVCLSWGTWTLHILPFELCSRNGGMQGLGRGSASGIMVRAFGMRVSGGMWLRRPYERTRGRGATYPDPQRDLKIRSPRTIWEII